MANEPIRESEQIAAGGDAVHFVRQRRAQHGRVATSRAQPDGDSAPVGAGRPWRGIGIGLLGAAALSVAAPFSAGYLQASDLAATYLPTGVVLVFLLILGLNVVLRAVGTPLTAREIMLAYVTMLIPSAMSTIGLAMKITPLLAIVYYYATPVNEWAILHHPHIPGWMTPHGADVIDWYFEGLPEGETIPWGPWIRPIALWSLLAASLYFIMTALSIAFRKRWMDSERLQFPLAQIPLMIMGDDPHPSWRSSLFRNPLLWIGIAVPFVFHGINGLHEYFPSVPEVKLTSILLSDVFKGSRMLQDLPFSRWAGIQLNFYWSVIGISYLLRSEVSLGVWAFEWFYRFEELAFEISGIGYGQHNFSPLHTFGYSLTARYARVGAVVVASGLFLWASRHELWEMGQAAFGRRPRAIDAHETSEIPWWSFWMLASGLAIYFAWTYLAGMGVIIPFILLVFFLLIAVTTARIVAATGLLWVYDYFVPMQGLQKIVGTARIDPQSFTLVGFVDYAVLPNRANIMPQTLDGMRIARETRITGSHFFLGMTLGVIVTVVISFGIAIAMGYRYGAINLDTAYFQGGGNWLFDRVAGFQRYHVWTDWTVIGIITAGGGFMAGLLYLHRTFLWWPLYPLGFIIAGTPTSAQIWFPLFVGWVAKALVMRSSDASTYNRLKPIALGLLLGEFIAVGLWFAIDLATGTTEHMVFPQSRAY